MNTLRQEQRLLSLARVAGCGAGLLLVLSNAIAFAGNGPQLVDITQDAGIHFVHFNGMSGRLYYVETMGAGGALFDYDNDGDLDLYLVQGAMLGGDQKLSDATHPWTDKQAPSDRLFRNDLVRASDGSTTLRFTDVTETSLIRSAGYGIGATVGDIDNDGHLDLYVLNFGRNELWRNLGNGTFQEVAGKLGLADESFSVSASFTDTDGDQRLDLYVTNYLDFAIATNKKCLTDRGEQDYCGPTAYSPQSDALFMQQPTGKFVRSTNLPPTKAAGMGVVSADFDGNGVLDFYIGNDLDPNNLLLGQRTSAPKASGRNTSGENTSGENTDTSIRYTDDALLYGTALNRQGEAEASMGLDAADFDGDGDLDIFAAHFRRESNTLYVYDKGFFEDATGQYGLKTPSWQHTAFGVRFVDLDQDGDLDLFVANGAVTFQPGADRTINPYPLQETNQVFRNDGRRFVDASAEAGPALEVAAISRGVLSGDLDNDGDMDLVITNNSGAPQILRNDHPTTFDHWIGLDLRLAKTFGSRPALGATVLFDPQPTKEGSPTQLDGSPQPRQPRRVRVHNDGSYASASDPRVIRLLRLTPNRNGQNLHFQVIWPNGQTEHFNQNLADRFLDRYHTIIQGKGTQQKSIPE